MSTRARKQSAKAEPQEVEIHSVRPGSIVITPLGRMRMRLISVSPGSALVDFSKKASMFGKQIDVTTRKSIARTTSVIVEREAPRGWKPAEQEVKQTRARAEQAQVEKAVAKRVSQPIEPSPATPEHIAEVAQSLWSSPYEMVEALLVNGKPSKDVYESVKNAFPDYKGSVESIASKKCHLKKKGVIK